MLTLEPKAGEALTGWSTPQCKTEKLFPNKKVELLITEWNGANAARGRPGPLAHEACSVGSPLGPLQLGLPRGLGAAVLARCGHCPLTLVEGLVTGLPRTQE